MGGTILRIIKIDCYKRNFKEVEMDLFDMKFPVIPDVYKYYEINIIDTGETFKYELSNDFINWRKLYGRETA